MNYINVFSIISVPKRSANVLSSLSSMEKSSELYSSTKEIFQNPMFLRKCSKECSPQNVKQSYRLRIGCALNEKRTKPLVTSEKLLLLPFHIKLGLIFRQSATSKLI